MSAELTHLRPDEFHSLCGHLFSLEFPGLRAVDGSGGDEGVDAWVPATNTYFQFYGPATRIRSQKVAESLSRVAQHRPTRWVLVTNRDLTRGQWKWFDELAGTVTFPCEVWSGSKVLALLSKHTSVRDHYLSTDAKSQIAVGKQTGRTIANMAMGPGSNVVIKGAKKRNIAVAVAGTVAEDPYKVGYLEYLIRRYNKCKEWDVGKAAMRYPLIRVDYERDIGFGVRMTPLKLFEAACDYLQGRIRRTKLARTQHRDFFSSFGEFVRHADEKAGNVHDGTAGPL